MSEVSNLLNIENLTVAIPNENGLVPIIKNLEFNIPFGKTVALVGESGSGKSMTALAIMQLLPESAVVSSASQILLRDSDLLSLSEIEMRKIRGKQIGMIFQEAMVALNPVLTIEHQIQEVLRCHFNFSRNETKEQVLHLLNEVGIQYPKQCAQSYPHELSGGMRQRAMIAMALAGEPDLLIADEPTTALDVTLQMQVLKLLKTLQQKKNMSLLFITHDLGIVGMMADDVVVMKQGKIVEYAPTSAFFAAPQNDYSRQLFAAVPSFEKRKRSLSLAVNQQPLLKVNDLKVYYPLRKGLFKRVIGYVKAVDGISLTLHEGRTLALVGESGSGKTTAGMAILQLLPITLGNVYFEKIKLNDLSKRELRHRRKDFQVIFQDPYSSMDPRMLIQDILAEGMAAQKLYQNEEARQQRIDELLMAIGLPLDAKFRYPHEFSGGQRQRICIARAIAVNPKFIVCDEPTSALDVSVQMQILQLLMKLQNELKLSYLLITHNLAVVAYMADEVAVMYQGQIVEYGSVVDVLKNPKHPYTQKLIASVPQVDIHGINSTKVST